LEGLRWRITDPDVEMQGAECWKYWKEETILKHNAYFDGRVQSLALVVDGVNATVGVMEPGKYTFSTSSDLDFKRLPGVLNVQLPGDSEWREYAAGDTFIVAPGRSFEVEAAKDVAYICLYR